MHHLEELDGLAILRDINERIYKSQDLFRDDPPALVCGHAQDVLDHGAWHCLGGAVGDIGGEHWSMGVCCRACHDNHKTLMHTRDGVLLCGLCSIGGRRPSVQQEEWTIQAEAAQPIVVRTPNYEEVIGITKVTSWLSLCRLHHLGFRADVGDFTKRLTQRN